MDIENLTEKEKAEIKLKWLIENRPTVKVSELRDVIKSLSNDDVKRILEETETAN